VNVTFSEFPHSWGQNSIIARFEPSSALQSSISARTAEEKIVIIGAHQDSTNLLPFLGAPGADDDGSGTTSALTSFAALVNATFKPSTHPVEFHWYSAEEGGLRESHAFSTWSPELD
jgi:leucyl aminopeptidase